MGLGVFFIVWGHVLRTGHFRIYLYAFNVTLFFFLLGYTFKYGASLKEFLKKRFFRTMIPYYIWAIVSIMTFLLTLLMRLCLYGKILSECFMPIQEQYT
ncbi:acyltransferase family protein [Agathobacter rectalis]